MSSDVPQCCAVHLEDSWNATCSRCTQRRLGRRTINDAVADLRHEGIRADVRLDQVVRACIIGGSFRIVMLADPGLFFLVLAPAVWLCNSVLLSNKLHQQQQVGRRESMHRTAVAVRSRAQLCPGGDVQLHRQCTSWCCRRSSTRLGDVCEVRKNKKKEVRSAPHWMASRTYSSCPAFR